MPQSSLSWVPGHGPSHCLPWTAGGAPPSTHLVVDVEVPLIFILHDHAGFLQQEVRDLTPIWLPAAAELNLKVLALNPTEPCQPPRAPAVQVGEASGLGLMSLVSFAALPMDFNLLSSPHFPLMGCLSFSAAPFLLSIFP